MVFTPETHRVEEEKRHRAPCYVSCEHKYQKRTRQGIQNTATPPCTGGTTMRRIPLLGGGREWLSKSVPVLHGTNAHSKNLTPQESLHERSRVGAKELGVSEKENRRIPTARPFGGHREGRLRLSGRGSPKLRGDRGSWGRHRPLRQIRVKGQTVKKNEKNVRAQDWRVKQGHPLTTCELR